jgi:hypothetical protein
LSKKPKNKLQKSNFDIDIAITTGYILHIPLLSYMPDRVIQSLESILNYGFVSVRKSFQFKHTSLGT